LFAFFHKHIADKVWIVASSVIRHDWHVHNASRLQFGAALASKLENRLARSRGCLSTANRHQNTVHMDFADEIAKDQCAIRTGTVIDLRNV
jgi:hypothetical protein